MSAAQRAIYRVMQEHDYAIDARGAICTCGFIPRVNAALLLAQQDYHRGHVAEVLAYLNLTQTERHVEETP